MDKTRFKAFIEKLVTPTHEEWMFFESLFVERKLDKNKIYLDEGDVCGKIGFVINGSFRMYYRVEGEEICKDFQFENQFIGSLASLLTGEPSAFTVEAMEKAEIFEISKSKLHQAYDQYKVWERFGRKYAELLFIYKEKRETSFLLDSPLVRYQKLQQQHPDHIQRIPQKYLASYLGIKPETLSRIRKKAVQIHQ